MDVRAKDRQELRWNLALQYAGIALMVIQGVILVPVYLRFVSSADFGVWLVVNGFANWLTIIDPGVSLLAQQRISIALGQNRTSEASAYARQGMILSGGIACAIILFGLVGSGAMHRFVDPSAAVDRGTGWWLLYLTVSGVALSLVANYLVVLGVALREARRHAVVSILSAFAGIVVTLVLVWSGFGILALPIGVLARALIQVPISLLWLRKHLVGAPVADQRSTARMELRTLGWSALEKLAGTLALSIDVVLIGRLLDSEKVTSFVLTKRPMDMLFALLQRPIAAIAPTISYITGARDQERLNDLVLHSSVRVFWFLGLSVVAAAVSLEWLIGVWVGGQHFLGADTAWLLILGLIFSTSTSLFGNLYWAAGAALQFYKLNTLLSCLIVVGVVAGVHLNGINGLLVGALLPRILLAAWLFPWLAWRILRPAAEVRKAILSNVLAMLFGCTVGVAAGAAAVRVLDPVWMHTGVGIVAYLLVLAICSRMWREQFHAIFNRLTGFGTRPAQTHANTE